jgi:tetratricopeptide (TPR) repeat protein
MIGTAVFLVRFPRAIKFGLWIVLFLCAVGLIARYSSNLASYSASTASARTDYWKAGLRIFAHHPFLGTGPGTFGSVYPKYKSITPEDPRLLHNNFLQALSDSGVPGFLAYCAIWLWPLLRAIRNLRQASDPMYIGLTLGLLGWCVHGLIDFDQYIPSLAFLAFLFLGMLESRLSARTEARPLAPAFKVISSSLAIFFCLLALGRLVSVYNATSARTLSRENPYAAIRLFDRALAFSPFDALYHFDAAMTEATVGHDPMPHLERARRMDPYRSMYAWQVAQMIRQREGLSEKYFRAGEETINLSPKNALYHRALATDFEAVGQTEKAKSHWAAFHEIQRGLGHERASASDL